MLRKIVIINAFIIVMGGSAIQDSFIEVVHNNPLCKDLRSKFLSLSDSHERHIGELFSELYLNGCPENERFSLFIQSGNDKDIVFQAANYIARSYFAKVVHSDIFDIKKRKRLLNGWSTCV